MATTTVVPDPPLAKPGGGGPRFVAVRANLLPDEIVSARQLDTVRRQVLIGLMVVVVLLVGWFGLSWWQTAMAHRDLDDAQRQTVSLTNQQNEFAPLVSAQSGASVIRAQLQRLMVGDLSWTKMLATLRADAPSGVSLTNVAGTITTGAPGGTGSTTVTSGALNQTGKPAVGQLTITGLAGSKNAVAAYADKLATVPGLTAPLINTVTANGSTITFSLSVLVTSDALGGRYSSSTAPHTGGN